MQAGQTLGTPPPAAPRLAPAGIPLETLGLLSSLTSQVERLAAADPLRRYHSLRDQLRRSALDALSHAARALEPIGEEERRGLLLRTLGALYELETLAKVAAKAGALPSDDTDDLVLLAREGGRIIRGRLAGVPATLAQTALAG
jgi:hypothetical protein